MTQKQFDKGIALSQKFHCIGNETEGKDGCSSSNALTLYEHVDDNGTWYDGYCYSCCQYFNKDQTHSSSVGKELGLNNSVFDKRLDIPKASKAVPMTKQEVKAFIKSVGYKSNNYRGIRDEISQFFGHLTKLDSNGNVLARFYPETEGDSVTGYKCRNHPKDFTHGKRGKTGISSDLSGQIKFKNGGKYILIVGGEEDKAAAYQMLLDDQTSRGNSDYNPTAVVCPTIGEGGAARQCAANYDFLNSFENIIIGLDNDEAGKKATEELAKVLPAEKVKIATWSMKDPNEMLLNKKEKQFVRDFYSAKFYVNSGIRSSVELYDDFLDTMDKQIITLPSYMWKLQRNMKRAWSTNGRVVNIIADTSVGKSSHVNNMVHHWIFEEGLKPMIISLEATGGEYLEDLLSIHLGTNLSWFKTKEDVLSFLNLPENIEKKNDLLYDKEGNERFCIVDERDGKLKTIEDQIERAVKHRGCNIVIIDVTSDILRFLSKEEQEKHMFWQKMFVKGGISIVNVLHTRKHEKDSDDEYSKAKEQDALGTSSFIQSAHINIVLNRNKMSTDPIIKNITDVDLPKCRRGITGEVGKWYYDPETRKCYDYDDWLQFRSTGNIVHKEETLVDMDTGEIIQEDF